MPVFEPLPLPHHWKPAPIAAGPFAGLQGGAVAGLLTAEVEAMAGPANWGGAIGVTAWFLRPTPSAILRTEPRCVIEGGRVSVVDNALYAEGEAAPCAMVRVTLSRERPIDIPGYVPLAPAGRADPMACPAPAVRRAAHGGPWFMDAMEVREDGDLAWFRLMERIAPDAGPLAAVLGPADWTHGIARPVQGAVADPNPNLTVHLFRPPVDDWIGVRPRAHWQPGRGIGMGSGVLFDVEGEIGCVSMSVALVPMPKRG